MASLQSKTSKDGKTTHYVVLAVGGKRKWIKAGSHNEAKKLLKQIESLEDSKRNEKLGLSTRDVRVDEFFQEYAEHVRLHCAASTVQRYLGILNCFLVFLGMFHPKVKSLGQIKQEHIESFQKQRLQSLDLKSAADGNGTGVHKSKKLPSPQTVNYEISILRTAFMWAMDRELITKIPTKKVKLLKPVIGKQGRVLSIEECEKFLEVYRFSLIRTYWT